MPIREAPKTGAHTKAVLKEWLKVSDSELQGLLDKKVAVARM
jgi:crotonobetainyl-CoA:carnitine CoA-transferase CaiB-like acyl-CoA transferase